MPTRNFNANKSSLFAKTGSTELGGGQDDHLPVGGSYNGYTFRSAVRFALDYSGMKNIQSAVLYLRTSSQVHLAFSSDPDVLIARASGDWTANSASSSSEGGSGWSTAATNYPGPSLTTSGQVSKDVSTAESTWVSADITSIVKAWAPASVVGGGGAANYGVVLYGAATGDLTEFYSYTSGSKPYIVVTYTTDTAPTTTLTAPTAGQIMGTTRPTISGTGSDPDGDPVDLYYAQFVQGSTVVHDATLPGGPTFNYTPTVDLPGGAVYVIVKCQAGGLWSPDVRVDFTVDRPPVVVDWSAPPASGSNRRPVHTFVSSDPDGDALELYDVEVYQDGGGGVPAGAAVWVASSQTAGISGMTVNHTPGVDLPGGPLLARSRVRTGPADLWSAWSPYRAYFIALTTPTVVWKQPPSDGGWIEYDIPTFVNPAANPPTIAIWSKATDAPPSGQTLTREARGYAYGTAATAWAYDGPPQAPNTPTGGTVQQAFYDDLEANQSYGAGHARFIVGASGGGLVDTTRKWRATLLQWQGALFLGDQVTALHAALAGAGGDIGGWCRAQSSATAPNGSAPWRDLSQLATVVTELPATGAWLGLLSRFAHKTPDVDLLGGLGHWDGPNPLSGWNVSGQVYVQGALEGTPPPTGGGQLRITGDGVTSYPQATKVVEVIGGAQYRLNAYLKSAGLTTEIDCRVDALNLETGGNSPRGPLGPRCSPCPPGPPTPRSSCISPPPRPSRARMSGPMRSNSSAPRAGCPAWTNGPWTGPPSDEAPMGPGGPVRRPGPPGGRPGVPWHTPGGPVRGRPGNHRGRPSPGAFRKQSTEVT
jgi:hypothetical protein